MTLLQRKFWVDRAVASPLQQLISYAIGAKRSPASILPGMLLELLLDLTLSKSKLNITCAYSYVQSSVSQKIVSRLHVSTWFALIQSIVFQFASIQSVSKQSLSTQSVSIQYIYIKFVSIQSVFIQSVSIQTV